MITGTTKNKIDKLWEAFWTGCLTNPLDVIEQITYLMSSKIWMKQTIQSARTN